MTSVKFFFHHVIPTTLLYYRGLLLRVTLICFVAHHVRCTYIFKLNLLVCKKIKRSVEERTDDLKVCFDRFLFLPQSLIKEDKVNADLCATLFNFIVEYGFEIGCNADSRISFETEKLRNFLSTRFSHPAESASSFFAKLTFHFLI